MENALRKPPKSNSKVAAKQVGPNPEAIPPTTSDAKPHTAEVAQASAATIPERRKVDDPAGVVHARRSTDKPATRKSQFFVTLCHWSMVALLAVETLTGMRMGWGYQDSPLGGPTGVWSGMLNSFAPRGKFFGFNIMTVHNIGAWLLLVDVVVYIVYLCRSGAFKRIKLTINDLQALKQVADKGGFWESKKALWSANLALYWFGFLSIFMLLVSGIALYRIDLGWHHYLGGYRMTHVLHGLFTYVFLPFTFFHVLLQWQFGTLWSIFKASFYGRHVVAGCLGLILAVAVVSGLYAWNQLPPTMRVKRLQEGQKAPVIDGDPNDKIWENARLTVVKTVKGINNPKDELDIAVAALHDGRHIYFRFQWDDPDLSVKRFPLLKTPDGWMVMQTGLEQNNENTYYEDKLAVFITQLRNNRGCASSCHLGEGDLRNPKGVHYTDGEIADLWQWQAISVNPTGAVNGDIGLVLDGHVGTAKKRLANDQLRYNGGRDIDPGRGGHRENFVKLDQDKPITETRVRPIKLPGFLRAKLSVDPAKVETEGPWWIPEGTGLAYSQNADRYPIWTVIPNVLVSAPEGDRADVFSRASWKKGRWTVEMKRLLDTKSKFDVRFKVGKSVYMSVAAFNRSETRHSEHLRPIRVALQP